MDLDQLEQRIDWLDDERRKDKNRINDLEEQIISLQGSLAAERQIKEAIQSDVTHLKTIISRMDQFDTSLAQHRVELSRSIDEKTKDIDKKGDDKYQLLRIQIKNSDKNIGEIQQKLSQSSELKREILTVKDDVVRQNRLISEVKQSLKELVLKEEEQNRVFRKFDDAKRQETKRMIDIQAELSGLKSRIDEQRGRVDISSANLKKIETRHNELLISEKERRDAQSAFIERQGLTEVDRERVWNEWVTRIDNLETLSSELEDQLQVFDSIHNTVKRSINSVEDISNHVERRVSEIIEVQRLTEERFRQEWVTFKADDQKRWTNYTITQEEQKRATNRIYDALGERVTILEDLIEELNDIIQVMADYSNKRLRELLTLTHEWVSSIDETKTNKL